MNQIEDFIIPICCNVVTSPILHLDLATMTRFFPSQTFLRFPYLALNLDVIMKLPISYHLSATHGSMVEHGIEQHWIWHRAW